MTPISRHSPKPSTAPPTVSWWIAPDVQQSREKFNREIERNTEQMRSSRMAYWLNRDARQ